MMDIRSAVETLDAGIARTALADILEAACNPAFGALPKREMDLRLFTTMSDIGVVAPDASPYQLMTTLRISRAKAQSLVFERELRRRSAADLDALAVAVISAARFVSNGGLFAIEIEDRLTREHVADRLRHLGHQSDGSFNGAIIRVSLDAARDLVTDLMPEDRRRAVLKALRDAGAPDDTIKGAVGRALKAVGGKAAGAAGDMATDTAKDHVKTLLIGSAPAIVAAFQGLLT